MGTSCWCQGDVFGRPLSSAHGTARAAVRAAGAAAWMTSWRREADPHHRNTDGQEDRQRSTPSAPAAKSQGFFCFVLSALSTPS